MARSKGLVRVDVIAVTALLAACGNQSKLDTHPPHDGPRQAGEGEEQRDISLAAMTSVVRVGCMVSQTEYRSIGSSFSHTSGVVISAAHVISLCDRPQNVVLLDNANTPVRINAIRSDDGHDLALFYPARRIGDGLRLAKQIPRVGTRLTAWGWPHGFNGVQPLVSVGYYAGYGLGMPSQKTTGFPLLWADIAATHGNSGGPIIDAASDEVVGVLIIGVSPKPSPLIEGAFAALLKESKAPAIYSGSNSDGTKFALNEAQTQALLVNWIRQQVNLGFAGATPSNDVAAFLRSNNIEP